MTDQSLDLKQYGITVGDVWRNAVPARLYEAAIQHDKALVSSAGALISLSGSKTGRSPKDKRIVKQPASSRDIWWGDVNIPLDEETFGTNRERAIDFLNFRSRLYVVDGYAGWHPSYRLKIRLICARPYHAIFMHNMLIRPTAEELANFGEPDFVIYNAGEFPANLHTRQMTSKTSVDLNFGTREFVILGTEYAGEMKKGVFTIMNYLMPKQGVFSMHCSANEGAEGDVTLFFGLSGTGKTTLSADPHRRLIGDDEHCWSDDGVFNIEGGCYAKCINLSAEKEPEIYQAIRYGTVLENVVCDPITREVDYNDGSITENTRASYPIEHIAGAKIPCLGDHPRNIIFLSCDAFGVLPPVSKLTSAQAKYHFISGYTAKVAGTEQGITEPQATFSACFGAAFLAWHPTKYAKMLAARMKAHHADAWLINTGWSGGSYHTGSRIPLTYTRAIIDAIHSGELARTPTVEEPHFGLHVPKHCPGVPKEMLMPSHSWADKGTYRQAAHKLVQSFRSHFAQYADEASEETIAAGPRESEEQEVRSQQ